MRFLLCGTNYGATYLQVLGAQPGGPRLAGLMSRGSSHSRLVARQAGLPLWTSLDQIPEGAIDAAIVAVPGQGGTDLILGLLGRGVPVLAEHPQGPKELEAALDLAEEGDLALHVNSHYADLATIAPFVEHARELRQRSPLIYLSATFNPRTAFSTLEILARVLGDLDGFEIAAPAAPADAASSPGPVFAAMPATLGGVGATLLCQRVVSLADDGSATLVSHQLVAGFPGGNLLLADTFGPVVWSTRLSPAISPWLPAWSHLGPPPELVGGGHGHVRAAANLLAVGRFAHHVRTREVPPMQTRAHLLGVARAWEATFAALGPTMVGGY